MHQRFTRFEETLIVLGTAFAVFALFGGDLYGWTVPRVPFTLGSWTWPLGNVSVIPFAFWAAALAFALFAVSRYFERLEDRYFSWDDIPGPEVRHHFKTESPDKAHL